MTSQKKRLLEQIDSHGTTVRHGGYSVSFSLFLCDLVFQWFNFVVCSERRRVLGDTW